MQSSLSNSLRTGLLTFVVRRRGGRIERLVADQARNPDTTQAAVLQRILAAQAGTEYGRRHDFAGIGTPEGFRDRVPVNDYETLRPWIEKQDTTGVPAINGAKPVSYAVTSGTTGKPKYIPVLDSTLQAHRRIQDLFTFRLLMERPQALRGRILAIVSPAVEGYSPGGLPCGSTSGQMYESIPGIVQAKYVVPPAAFAIEDYDTKYLLILRLALACPDITYITTANPSTLARLIGLARSHWTELVRDVREGGFHVEDALAPSQRRALRRGLRPQPARADQLEALARRSGPVRIRDLWPDLDTVGVWTGGSSSIFFEQLEDEFSPETCVRDIGYLASEVRGSVPLHAGSGAGIPTFWENYFEFVSAEEWDREDRTFLGLHQLEDGKRYYVFVTTDAGLYRYHMNDIVEVDGFYERVPRLRFVQKGKGVTSITGEKLYESQAISAVTQATAEFGVSASFYMMLADEAASRYVLYLEPAPLSLGGDALPEEMLAKSLDSALARANVEYEVKRKSGRLEAPRLVVLRRGAYERYKRHCLERGQREGQFKIVALQFAREVAFDFEAEAAGRECELEEAAWPAELEPSTALPVGA